MQIIQMSSKFCDVKKSGHVYCRELRLQKVAPEVVLDGDRERHLARKVSPAVTGTFDRGRREGIFGKSHTPPDCDKL